MSMLLRKMSDEGSRASFEGDPPHVANREMLHDRRELALVAVERTRMPMVVTDPRLPDNPIVLANKAFLDLTAYPADEVIGRNCRFLQGKGTDPAAIEAIRTFVASPAKSIEVELLNYRKDGTAFLNQLYISPVFDAEGTLLYHFASQKDVTAERRAEELEAAERMLLMEVDHRAMNALALVQSFVNLTRAETVSGFAMAIRGRVQALARAHRMLGEASWSGADLGQLVASETPDEHKARVVANGASVLLPTPIVQPMALVLHELMSNAARHGALRVRDGTLAVEWVCRSRSLHIGWRETGATSVSVPAAPGVGLQMMDNVVKRQLGGMLATKWMPGGLHVDLTVPLGAEA